MGLSLEIAKIVVNIVNIVVKLILFLFVEEAASENGVYYYPILTKHEKES